MKYWGKQGLLLVFLFMLTGMRSLPKRSLIGSIEVIQNKDDVIPPFSIYFAGRTTTNNKDGIYQLTLDSDDFEQNRLKKLSLMICKQIDYAHGTSGMPVEKIMVGNLKKYQYFDLERVKDPEKNLWHWNIIPKTLDERNFKIPKNCIVVSLSTNCFDRLEDTTVALENEVMLPRIILKASSQALARQSNKSALDRIDHLPYHIKARHHAHTNGTVTVQLPVYP